MADPEPLVELTNQLLSCTHLHSLLVKIVFLKASVHDVCAVSTTLNLLSSWMCSLQQRLFADAARSAEPMEAACSVAEGRCCASTGSSCAEGPSWCATEF